MIRTLTIYAAFITVLFSTSLAMAEAQVFEGDEAKAMYEKTKDTSYTLKQQNKVFTLVDPEGTEIPAPEEMTISVGDNVFITNNEEEIIHNVYDQSDHSWVLKKQYPDGVAAVTFNKPGTHKLRCAIHPKMRITVNVEEKSE